MIIPLSRVDIEYDTHGVQFDDRMQRFAESLSLGIKVSYRIIFFFSACFIFSCPKNSAIGDNIRIYFYIAHTQMWK